MNKKQGAPLRLTPATSPCKGCPDRSTGEGVNCHSTCEKYAAFRAECDALAEDRRNKRDYNDYIDDTIRRFPGLRNI